MFTHGWMDDKLIGLGTALWKECSCLFTIWGFLSISISLQFECLETSASLHKSTMNCMWSWKCPQYKVTYLLVIMSSYTLYLKTKNARITKICRKNHCLLTLKHSRGPNWSLPIPKKTAYSTYIHSTSINHAQSDPI